MLQKFQVNSIIHSQVTVGQCQRIGCVWKSFFVKLSHIMVSTQLTITSAFSYCEWLDLLHSTEVFVVLLFIVVLSGGPNIADNEVIK